MQFLLAVVSIVFSVCYFGMKYTYALRASSYSRQPAFSEVWLFSFDTHPNRRSVVPFKYIAIFFALLAITELIFRWDSPFFPRDINSLWKLPVILLVGLNNWARVTIYEITHWRNGIEKSMPGPAYFVMMRRSIKEIGWFPDGDDWLSKLIVVSNIFILVICVVRLTLFFL